MANLPLVLQEDPGVQHLQRLNRLLLVRNVGPPYLEASQWDRFAGLRVVGCRSAAASRPRVRVGAALGQEVVSVQVEVVERVVRVKALRAREEHVLGFVTFRAQAKRERVVAAVDREAVLQLEAAVTQLVVGRERLESESRVCQSALENVNPREERPSRVSALVVVAVSNQQVVGHVAAAELRVPLAHDGPDVFLDDVVGVLEVKRIGAGPPVAESQGRRVGRQHVGIGVQMVVPDANLVPVVEIVVHLGNEPGGGCLVVIALVRAGLVPEVGGEISAQRVQIGPLDPRDATARGLAAFVGPERGAGLREPVVLEAREEEQLVAHDGAAQVHPDAVDVERAYGDLFFPGRATVQQPSLVTEGVIQRSREFVGAAARHSVHAGANKVALTYVVGCNVDLHLLDRGHGDGRHVGPVARLAAQAERVVEVRTVHRDVVQTVVLAHERAAAGLRCEPREVLEASRYRGEYGQARPRDERGGAGPVRAEDGLTSYHDLRKTNRSLPHDDGEFGGCAQSQIDVVMDLAFVPYVRSRNPVRAAHPHAGYRNAPVGAAHRAVRGAGGLVHRRDPGTLESCALRVGYATADSGGRNTLRDHGGAERDQEDRQQRAYGKDSLHANLLTGGTSHMLGIKDAATQVAALISRALQPCRDRTVTDG